MYILSLKNQKQGSGIPRRHPGLRVDLLFEKLNLLADDTMDLEELRKTYQVYDKDPDEEAAEEHSDMPENMEDPQFDLEYVAKVLDYKSHLVTSKTVGIISYRNPYDIR
jgi:hypothetical protein